MVPPKKLEISFINLDKSQKTAKKVNLANLVKFYCMKLRKTIRPSYFMKNINNHHLSNIFINTNNDIH